MIHHLSLGVHDIEGAARFYDAVLGTLGHARVWTDLRPGETGQAVGYGPPGGGDVLALKQVAQPAGDIPGQHIAFGATTHAAVEAFHAAALAHGGRDNGTPGWRPDYGEDYYAAFVVDPEGHRLEAVCRAVRPGLGATTPTVVAFERRHLPAALALWRSIPGIGLSKADEPAALAAFLRRNPGLSFVALDGGELVGTLLCGHDGRRGLIHHLAVAPARRRRGLGRALLDAALAALQAQGIDKCHLMVFADNAEGLAFWRRQQAVDRVELALLSIATTTRHGD
ncbi:MULTISPECIES: GNAT family N-acetyltransferase [unclassified Rubrivivax]|uniref:GNAT family N-acetyltransferase n=1 Tax=unclassified Rubrivivax TaxID=2649762 RepID=UPI002873CA9A|nr:MULTISPECIES: GNAT family N-acetyltransferase [unclassified Rubrivivax]